MKQKYFILIRAGFTILYATLKTYLSKNNIIWIKRSICWSDIYLIVIFKNQSDTSVSSSVSCFSDKDSSGDALQPFDLASGQNMILKHSVVSFGPIRIS